MRRCLPLLLWLLFLASVAQAADRVHRGRGSFPQWRATLTLPSEAPLLWIVALPPRLAAIDREGTFWIFELSDSGLRVAGRYGEVGSPHGPPVAVRASGGATVAFASRTGRLLLWADGVLRSADVGTPLSSLTALAPVELEGHVEFLALSKDGGLLLIGGPPSWPRVVAHLELNALPDARIAVGDLDQDSVPEAVILSDPTERYPHGILGDRLEAGSLAVVEARPFGLALKGRYALPAPVVFEDLAPILADLGGDARRQILVAKSSPDRGAAVAAFGWDGSRIVPFAEAPAIGRPNRWTNLLGAADLDGDGIVEVLTVHTPHIGGVLTAYHRKDAALVPVAHARGYSTHAIGSRNQDQAAVADLDGNGWAEVILPRQSRDTLAGLELAGHEFVERWTYRLRGPIASNLVIADFDGDGLLDLAVADTKGLHVLLSRR